MGTAETSSSLADTGILFANVVGKVAGVAMKVGEGVQGVDSVLGAFASFIPYYPQAMAVLRIATPILAKISAAAPAVAGAIEAGRPIIEAAQEAAPAIMPHLKQLLAITMENVPGNQGAGMSASHVSDEAAVAFLGTMFGGVFERSFFTPQDPRFDRNKSLG